jgi:hypothetical protein
MYMQCLCAYIRPFTSSFVRMTSIWSLYRRVFDIWRRSDVPFQSRRVIFTDLALWPQIVGKSGRWENVRREMIQIVKVKYSYNDIEYNTPASAGWLPDRGSSTTPPIRVTQNPKCTSDTYGTSLSSVSIAFLSSRRRSVCGHGWWRTKNVPLSTTTFLSR